MSGHTFGAHINSLGRHQQQRQPRHFGGYLASGMATGVYHDTHDTLVSGMATGVYNYLRGQIGLKS